MASFSRTLPSSFIIKKVKWFFSPKSTDWLWGAHKLLFNEYRGFPQEKGRGMECCGGGRGVERLDSKIYQELLHSAEATN